MDVIASARLDLVSLGSDIVETLWQGSTAEASDFIDAEVPPRWIDEEHQLFEWRLEQMLSDPASQPWLLRALVVRESRAVAGYFNFHGPPGEENWVELGYTIEPNQRRKGYATEAAVRMMTWAADEHGVEKFRASVSPSNLASLGMIAKLGFQEIGTQWDEIDGEETVFMRTGAP